MAASQHRALKEYVNKLNTLVSSHNFSLNPRLINEFSQQLGEAHFFLLCLEKGLKPEKIKEGKEPTPDFKCIVDQKEVFFEVKTLSVANGDSGINDSLNNGLNSQIDIESQIRKGKKIVISEQEIKPFGDKPYNEKPITFVVNALIEKIRGNLKEGQFVNENTFLVVNLSMISPVHTQNFVLRPAYCDDYMFPKAVTGELWMVGFCKPGMLIHGTPEFEGKPCIEGVIEKLGILNERQKVAGILFMIHPFDEPMETWGLFRSCDYSNWEDKCPWVLDALLKLVGNNWNDEKDTNGYDLSSRIVKT